MPSGVYTRTVKARRNIGLGSMGRIPWNKGLTKKIDPRLSEFGRKISRIQKGKKLSDEHKANIKKALPNGTNWKGGKSKRADGYITILLPEHPRANSKGRVREHILVAEKKIGRSLEDGERVHHLNGIRYDNRPENLIVIKTHADHIKQYHQRERDKMGKFAHGRKK